MQIEIRTLSFSDLDNAMYALQILDLPVFAYRFIQVCLFMT